LGQGEIVNAALPPSTTVVAADDSGIYEQDKQKIAGLFDLPKIPISIPGLPGGNPLDIAKNAVIKEIGQAVGVGSPLLLDQKTAYPDVSDQIKDFHPQKLTITSAEDLKTLLPPGDYSLDVIAYCTQFSIHAPGQGLPYKLAPLQGKQAPAIGALLSRGTLQGIAPATLNANAWRIQAGLPLKQWPPQDQALIHKLIPEYEKGLEGDYLQQIENTYNQFRIVPGIPSFNDLLRQSGAPGQLVLQLRQARQTLADQTISSERLPDMLYEPTGDGLPRVLPASKDASPSHWAEIKPGVFARFTVIEGNLGRNLLEFRVTPKAIAAANDSGTMAAKSLNKSLNSSNLTYQANLELQLDSILAVYSIVYSISRAAQALIIVYFTSPEAGHPCNDPTIKNEYSKSNPRYHRFENPEPPKYPGVVICNKKQKGCDKKTVFDTMISQASFVAPTLPWQEHNPVRSCALRLLFPAPGLTDGPLSNVPTVIISNWIRTQINPQKYSITNYTLPGHIFYPGEIRRTVIDTGSAIQIQTVGEGVGEYKEMDVIISKIFLWDEIDRHLRDEVQSVLSLQKN
jgi:hypothetical protein